MFTEGVKKVLSSFTLERDTSAPQKKGQMQAFYLIMWLIAAPSTGLGVYSKHNN
jgi:hypothetical protein